MAGVDMEFSGAGGGGGCTHITSAKPGSRARLRALEALGEGGGGG